MNVPRIERIDLTVCTGPTDAPEADGTLAWDATTIVIVEAHGGGRSGLGYTYSHAAAATLIADKLTAVVEGRDAMAVPGAWQGMVAAVRNYGRSGIAASAIAALDVALADLKARLLEIPLYRLLGPVATRSWSTAAGASRPTLRTGSRPSFGAGSRVASAR